jgi:zinc-ribbon domain
MQCPSCGQQNREEAQYCYNCGTPLPQGDVALNEPSQGQSAPIQPQQQPDLNIAGPGGVGWQSDDPMSHQPSALAPQASSPTVSGRRLSRRTILIGLVVLLILLMSSASIALLLHTSQAVSSHTGTPTPIPTTNPTTQVTISPTPTATPGTTPTATPGTTPTPTPTSVPFQVTTINLSVNPLSVAGKSCGTPLTVTYTATFNVLPKGPGGAIQFTYTTDGGSTTKTGVKQLSSGETSMQFQFTASGTVQLNGAFPGAGQVTTTSPNTISSQAVTPSGACTPVSPTPVPTP